MLNSENTDSDSLEVWTVVDSLYHDCVGCCLLSELYLTHGKLCLRSCSIIILGD
jgi:hypothetical protein